MKKYAILGISNRAMQMFIEPLAGAYSDGNRVVALLDIDSLRFELCKAQYPALADTPCYRPDQFGEMIRETKPDAIIVAGRDDTHIEYILQGLAHHLEVMTEKPMVTNAADAVKVLEAERNSKGSVKVTFNYRYSPFHRRIKEMILEGKLGRITSVDLNWYVDTYHGASYFRRWNRMREHSGGLSVHKSTHHIDLVNWWLDQKPEEVFAFGALNYYGPGGEHNPSVEDGRYCSTCREKRDCAYMMRWSGTHVRDDHVKANEAAKSRYTHYRADACIFDSEINIEDTYTATVRYDRGALLSYSINFSAPYEGYRLAINGTKGRLETTEYHEPSRVPFPFPGQTIDYYPLFGSKEIIHVVQNPGGHGGGDPLLLEELFEGPNLARGYSILAGAEAGAASIAVGEAIWRSSREKRMIRIGELLGER